MASMTSEQVKQAINGILVEEFEVPAELLTPDATLYEKLGIDSLDAVDLVVTIEKHFDCEIVEEEAKAMRTLGDIYAHVEQRVGGKPGPEVL